MLILEHLFGNVIDMDLYLVNSLVDVDHHAANVSQVNVWLCHLKRSGISLILRSACTQDDNRIPCLIQSPKLVMMLILLWNQTKCFKKIWVQRVCQFTFHPVNEGFDFPCFWNLHALELIFNFGVDAFRNELGVFALVALPVKSEEELTDFLEKILLELG